MKLKTAVNDPKLWQGITAAIVTAILGYFGYTQQSGSAPADVDITVNTPEHTEPHTHPPHKHKDWMPVIREELEKARAEHTRVHH